MKLKRSAKISLAIISFLVIGCENNQERLDDYTIHTDTNTKDTVEVYQNHGAGFFYPWYIYYNQMYYYSGNRTFTNFSGSELSLSRGNTGGKVSSGRTTFSTGMNKGFVSRGGFGGRSGFGIGS